MLTFSEFSSLWPLACDILNDRGHKTGNYSDARHGGSGGPKTDHGDWAMQFRGYSTEREFDAFQVYTRTGHRVDGFSTMVRRFSQRVPDHVIAEGWKLYETL